MGKLKENILQKVIRDNFIEAIVILLIYFFGPFKSIHDYRDWPLAEEFIINITAFLFLSSFLINTHKIGEFIKPAYSSWTKIRSELEFISSSLSRRINIILDYINYIIIILALFTGVRTILSATELYKYFIQQKNPFFWNFMVDYLIYLVVILTILILIHYVSNLIEKIILKKT